MKRFALSAIIVALALTSGALAKDKVRLIDSQASVFDQFAIYQAQAEGYFDAENLDVSIIVGRGGSAALQILTTGNAEMLMAPGIFSVIAAYAKGAPVTIVGSGEYGVNGLYWYVKADSPIKSLKDMDGKILVIASPGSLSDLAAHGVSKALNIRPKMVSVGSFAASRTQVMSGQTDTGFSAVPANYDLVRTGQARVIGTGADAPMLRNMTTRAVVANSEWLPKNRDAAARMMRALWKGQQYNFSGEKALARYAEHWKIDLEDAKKVYDVLTLDDFKFAPIKGLDDMLQFALDYGFINQPLTAEQKKGLVAIAYEPSR